MGFRRYKIHDYNIGMSNFINLSVILYIHAIDYTFDFRQGRNQSIVAGDTAVLKSHSYGIAISNQ